MTSGLREEVLKDFPNLDKETSRSVEELYAALCGKVERDVLRNAADPMTSESLAKLTGEFAAFMSDEKNRALLAKK